MSLTKATSRVIDTNFATPLTASSLYVGSLTDTTNSRQVIRCSSKGYAGVQIDGDTSSASGEPGGAYVNMTCDAGITKGSIGWNQRSNESPDGLDAINGVTGNGLVLHAKNYTNNGNPIHLCTWDGTESRPRLTITTAGEVEITRLRLPGGDDVNPSSTNNPLQIGITDGPNMVFDSNEIMCRNNGALSTLSLNAPGGNVNIQTGSATSLGWQFIDASGMLFYRGYASASPPSTAAAGSVVTSGHIYSTSGIGVNVNPKSGLFVNNVSERFNSSNKQDSYPPGSEDRGFVSVFRASGNDDGGILIIVGDENGDEKAIDVWNLGLNDGQPSNTVGPAARKFSVTTDGTVSLRRIRAEDPGDVSLTSTGHCFQIGATDGPNLCIDSNEIMCRDDGEVTSLALNNIGGNVNIQTDSTTTGGWQFTSGGFFIYGGTTSNTGIQGSFITSGRLQTKGTYSSTNAAAPNISIDSNGLIWRQSSSLRYKKDIETIGDGYSEAAVFNSRPVWFRSKSEGDNPLHSFWGFIAEEVAEIDPRLVQYGVDEAGNPQPDGINYTYYIPHLCNIAKKQKQQIDTLTQQLNLALNRLTELESKIQS